MSGPPRILCIRPSVSTRTAVRSTASHCAASRQAAQRPFTTSPACHKDANRTRGLSAVRATGLRKRQTLSVRKFPIPVPVERTSEPVGNPEHGLYAFFHDKKLLRTPLEESRHGRAWTINELREKDWDTLHRLWWVCAKERNRLSTEKIERARLKAGYGDAENQFRDETVQKTMKAIMETLLERKQSWSEAYQLAEVDPTVDLSRTSQQYQEDLYDTEDLDGEDPNNEALMDPAEVAPRDVGSSSAPVARPAPV